MIESINLKNEIFDYFTEMGILLYGEYMLKKENNPNIINEIPSKYYTFLNNEIILSSLPTKINHHICYLFYQAKTKQDNINNINKKFISILSHLEIKLNYFNFILVCNLIHYYNEFCTISMRPNHIIFFLNILKNFSKLIINNEEHIKDEYESNILVLLFYYYYSILTYSLLKNTNYVCKSNLTDNFQDYVKQKLDLLYDDDEYTSKFNNLYDNQYISLHLNELNNYAERARNMKLDYYIRYIQFLLSIYEDDNNEARKFDFFFYDDNKLSNEIKLNILFREYLYTLINYDEKKIEKCEKKINNNNNNSNDNDNNNNNDNDNYNNDNNNNNDNDNNNDNNNNNINNNNDNNNDNINNNINNINNNNNDNNNNDNNNNINSNINNINNNDNNNHNNNNDNDNNNNDNNNIIINNINNNIIINNINNNDNNINNNINDNINNNNDNNNININNNEDDNNININNNIYKNKLDYLKVIMESNKNLIDNNPKNNYKKNIILDKNKINNLSIINDEYHQYNIKVLEKNVNPFDNNIGNNLYLYLISKNNEIAKLTEEYLKDKQRNDLDNKYEKKDQIFKICSDFFDYLDNKIEDEDIDIIIKLKILKKLLFKCSLNL